MAYKTRLDCDTAWAEKEREIEREEKEAKVEKFKPSMKKETPIEPSIIQSPVEEKKEIKNKQSINNINELKKPIKLFTQCQHDPFVNIITEDQIIKPRRTIKP